jgi:serine O-acetyltransferase
VSVHITSPNQWWEPDERRLAEREGLLPIVHEDWHANFRDWTLPGFRALAVHRFGNWVQQRRWALVRVVLRRLYTALFRYVRNHYRIELPVTASIGRRVVIGRHGGIVVHANAIIGDDCVLRQRMTLGAMTRERGEQAPTRGRGVVVDGGAVILGGVTIGDRARLVQTPSS